MSVYFVFLHVLRSFLVVTREVIKRGQKGPKSRATGTKWVQFTVFLKIIKHDLNCHKHCYLD